MIITTPLIENHTSRFVGGGHQPEGHMLDYHGSIGKTGITSSTITRYVTIEKEKKKRESSPFFQVEQGSETKFRSKIFGRIWITY